MVWTDAPLLPTALRFYAVGNADLDTDGDGLLDAREVILYGSSPSEVDTDSDGTDDYEEVVTNRTDPSNSDTNAPTVLIYEPADGSRRVLLP